MAEGAGSGFLGGLLGGIGQSIAQHRLEKHEQDVRSNQQVAAGFLRLIEEGDVDPEVGFPIYAQILSGDLSAITGETKGKGGKGKGKGGNPLTDLFTNPENLSSLLVGFHKSMNPKDVPMSEMPQLSSESGTLGQTSVVDKIKQLFGMPTKKPIEGQAAQASSTGGDTPATTFGTGGGQREVSLGGGTTRPSIFKSRAQKLREAEELKTTESEANIVGSERGRMLAAEELQKRFGLDKEEALQRVGLKQPVTATTRQGTFGGLVQDRIEEFKVINNREPTAGERAQITLETRQKWAAQTQKPAGPLDKQVAIRAERLRTLNPNLGEDASKQMATRLIETEGQEKFQTALKKSLVEIQKNEEQLKEMRDRAPLTLKAKELGVLLDQKRLAAVVAGKDPGQIIEQARKFAHTVVQQREKNKGWWASLKQTLGFAETDPTEDELVDEFITEWTGQEPEVIKTEAMERHAPVPTSAPSGSRSAPAYEGSDVTVKPDGTVIFH